MLIDVTDVRQMGELQAQAERCRRLARETWDQQTTDALLAMAAEYEDKARDLQARIRARQPGASKGQVPAIDAL